MGEQHTELSAVVDFMTVCGPWRVGDTIYNKYTSSGNQTFFYDSSAKGLEEKVRNFLENCDVWIDIEAKIKKTYMGRKVNSIYINKLKTQLDDLRTEYVADHRLDEEKRKNLGYIFE